MSITYPLTFPTAVGPSSTTWLLAAAVGALESDFTFQQQVQESQGQRWEISMQFPRMTADQAGQYRAFFAKLRGQLGTFLIGDYTRALPKGSITGNPLVKGGSQTGNSLIIDGLTHSINGILKAGDWIQLGTGGASRLHMVVEDANSNSSGEATLTIEPELRSSPADNAAVTYQNCMGVFRLTKEVPFSTSGTDHTTLNFSAVEVV